VCNAGILIRKSSDSQSNSTGVGTSKSSGSSSTPKHQHFEQRQQQQQQYQQQTSSAATLPVSQSLHEDVTQFLAGFSSHRPEADGAYAEQLEEFVNALSHQLPLNCFHISCEDNPLLCGVGTQFERR
jgi:hypothetical protein